MVFFKKIYEDFLKASRLNQYKKLLQNAKNKGYKMMGILDFYNHISNNNQIIDKILINRHDIDTSPKTARKMFEIEKSVYGNLGSSTFYFRDKTTDLKLINDIENFGYETGYHYETISNYDKKNYLGKVDLLKDKFNDIEEEFEKEFESYKRKTKTESLTISSHGDFVNVFLNFQNYELLKNNIELRKRNNIVVEAYDECINKYVEKRFADQVLIEKFCDTVNQNLDCNVVLILTHPRQWKKDILWNIKDNIIRIIEGIKYKNGIKRKRKQ